MNTTTHPRLHLAGHVIAPGDPDYDDARRIWNGAIDRRPALIARCAGEKDVVAALRHGREHGLPIAVRCGGHGVAGHAVCDDGLVIDLSPMRAVAVDPSARTARVQGGALLGDVDAATQPHGLAVPAGVVSHTGVGGLTLGGGIGWLTRKHGATVDNLRSARVVTADGRVVTASATEHPDLFWGLRGGGGNFGIVTEFGFAAQPLGPTVLAGPVYYDLDEAPAVLHRYREVVAEAPDGLMTLLNLRRAPAIPLLPEELHGRPTVAVVAFYAGDVVSAERVIRPLRQLGTPLVDLIEPRPFVQLQELFNASVPHGWHYHWRSVETAALSDGVVDALVDATARITSPRSYAIVFHLGGALARVPAHATAYAQREAGFNVNVNAVWLERDPDAESHIGWARGLHAALAPHTDGRVYVNFLDDEGGDRVRAAYGDVRYRRLADVKRRWDPDNVFRLNHNVPPAAA